LFGTCEIAIDVCSIGKYVILPMPQKLLNLVVFSLDLWIVWWICL